MNNTLEVFVDRLIEEKGLEYLDEEIRAQMKSDLLERVEDRINASILEHMPPEALEEFEKFLDADTSDEEMQVFVAKKIPNMEEMLATVLLEFRQTYLSN